jgi:hypothetical protein
MAARTGKGIPSKYYFDGCPTAGRIAKLADASAGA